MKTIYIRNVDAGVLAKLDETAKSKGLSRNKLVNLILDSYVASDKVKEVEDKYSVLVETVAEAISNNTSVLENIQSLFNKED